MLIILETSYFEKLNLKLLFFKLDLEIILLKIFQIDHYLT